MDDDERRRRRSTQARDFPGAFEGETVTRRRFMTGTADAAGAIAGAAIRPAGAGLRDRPGVSIAKAASWQDVGELARFKTSDYTPVVITIEPGVG